MQVAGIGSFTALLAMLALVGAPVAAQQSQQKPPAKPATTPANAASAAASGVKIAFVNARRVLQSAPGWTEAEQTYAKESEGYRTELNRLQTSLDSAAQEFERQAVLLSPTQRQEKRTELDKKRQAAEARASELQQKAGQRQQELLQPIQDRVNTVIDGIRAEGNYAMIFDVSAPGSGIVAADRSLDITDRVIERLKSGS